MKHWESANHFEVAGDVAGMDAPRPVPQETASLASWEQGAKIDRPRLRFHELFERVLDADLNQRNRPAVITPTTTITYRSLEQDANVIAHSLLESGAVRGMVVGVLTGRSANLPAAALGIWKAGATYLPLAADLPPERLEFMARDAGMARWIVLDGLAAPIPDSGAPLRPEDLGPEFRRRHSHRPQLCRATDSAAYIIYTSGSTGRPKGTLIGHDAYVNSVLGAGETLGLTKHDRSLMFSSPSFDVSLSDMGLPLAFGGALCPVPAEVLNSPDRFRSFLAELGVTVADVTPTYLRLFEGAQLPSLRILVTGGEAPIPADVEIYSGRLQYFNAYGPTENTITSTMKRLCPGERGNPSGGRPLPNTSIQVCDPEGNRVPPGVVGELWLGGAGLAQGYIGRADLTAAAFVETAQGRRYRTGDLGRWRAGEIEILGRIDDQVKVNGIRIELGEVEHVLGGHPDVAQAVALVDGDAERGQSLWAFVRPAPEKDAPAEGSWREYLSSRLPAYMIPSRVISIPSVPLSHSGKVDKTALRSLLAEHSPGGTDSVPQAGLETQIARLWAELLKKTSGIVIRRDDNFFALGGHSLLAIAFCHRLEKALGHIVPVRDLFAEPTLRGFAQRVAELSKTTLPPKMLSDRATSGQHEFWVAEQAGLDTRGFNLSLALLGCGNVPPEAHWQAAWAELKERHESLRTGFRADPNGMLRRFVLPEMEARLEISTCSDMPTALAHARERQMSPFKMEHPPLWRAGLVYVSAVAQPVFWLALHHSVGDGISLGVLVEELSARLQGRSLPALTGRFDESAGREESYLASSACLEDASYWRKTLGCLGSGSSDTPQPLDEWPLDFPRHVSSGARSRKGSHSFKLRLDASTANGLRDLAKKEGVSLHALMLAIMAHEVRRRTGRSESLIGTATSARASADEARMVGYYVNVLPVPCRVHEGGSFEELLRATQQNLAEGLQHARYPFVRIHRDFRQDHALGPHPARFPLSDFTVTENPAASTTGRRLPGEEDSSEFHFGSVAPPVGDAVFYEPRTWSPPQDMVLAHEAQPDGSLILQWFVDASLYEKETARAWISSVAGWARYLTASQRVPGSPLPALLPDEEHLLAGREQGRPLPHSSSIAAQFEHWALVQPDHPALVAEEGIRSYAALNARSNALAHALSSLGVARREPVGIFSDRSTELPEILLAIWKAGGCYVSLVPELPDERLAFMAREAGIRVLVVLDGQEPPACLTQMDCTIFRPENLSEDFLSSHAHPLNLEGGHTAGSELACILYTSGSTGVPKGVMLHHRGVSNLGLGAAAALGIRPRDRVMLLASPAFDAWLSDLAMAWTAGAAVVPILRPEMSDIAGLRAMVGRLGVTTATMTPSYLRLFEQAEFPGLRLLMTVGEPPHAADAAHYAARLSYFNGYGPTECTAAVSFGQVTADTPLTAGRPLVNTSVQIRGRQGERVPPGAAGEIWVGGFGLALGYLNRSDLTAASFVETSTGRMYRTGDWGRWTHTGELQVLGRSDGQIKLRGQRVELGEIERQLAAYRGVHQAVAAVESRADGSQNLWAFVCLHSGAEEPTQTAWHDYLSRTLPSYMLPLAVLSVPDIPVSLTGKTDRAALLRGAAIPQGRQQGAQPHYGMETQIADVWAEHLQLGSHLPRRADNFFDLGGDSLRAIAVVNQLRRTFECKVNDLYEHPQLADFARACRHRPGHLRTLLRSAAEHWRAYRSGLAEYEAEREAALAPALQAYEARSRSERQNTPGQCREYERVLLTGATGYLGSYLLREMLEDGRRHVSTLVRGADDESARRRLGQTLCHYFGEDQGTALRDNTRLTVLASDLRREDLGLSIRRYHHLADSVQAVFHSAANVKHFGHSREFHADNVASTARLLQLAAKRAQTPADFHFVSTLSVCGKVPEYGFRLFTEYDAVPEVPEAWEENYYIRSKQEAERLVAAARTSLSNACIYRVGNLVFSSEGGPLQFNIGENAFFQQIAALLRLGIAPDDSHLWPSYVDVVARGLVRLAGAGECTNETHHLENARRSSLADFAGAAAGVHACGFDVFLERLEAAVDDPGMDAALATTMETFGLYRGQSPQPRARRQEIVSGRTQARLERMGLVWPEIPAAGQAEMLRRATHFYSQGCQAQDRRAMEHAT